MCMLRILSLIEPWAGFSSQYVLILIYYQLTTNIISYHLISIWSIFVLLHIGFSIHNQINSDHQSGWIRLPNLPPFPPPSPPMHCQNVRLFLPSPPSTKLYRGRTCQGQWSKGIRRFPPIHWLFEIYNGQCLLWVESIMGTLLCGISINNYCDQGTFDWI